MQRPLRDQVVVITGASSGIGRETAIHFARCGAKLVLAARNKDDLTQLAGDITLRGGQAATVAVDVSQYPDVERLGIEAVGAFGRIDTWINDAGLSSYGTVESSEMDDLRRVIEVNLVGVMNGSKVALPYLRQTRGTLINIGSVTSEVPVPLQAAYVASKHGVKGFTDSLRQEMLHEKSGVTVTLILPAGINTPFFDHAKSTMGVRPKPTPPIYDPSVVADAIAFAATHNRRQIYAGGASRMMSIINTISPNLINLFLASDKGWDSQKDFAAPDRGQSTLNKPGKGATVGRFTDEAKSTSLYTKYADEYPVAQSLLATALVAGAAAVIYKVVSKPKPLTFADRIRSWSKPRSLAKPKRVVQRVRPSEVKHEIRQTLCEIARDLR
jgi:short-subunit dehydrogenase